MKKGIVALAITAGLMASSCLGVTTSPETENYKAWHAVKDWNHNATDSKWLNEAIFIGCNIIPVYGIAALIDVFILNSIDFWQNDKS